MPLYKRPKSPLGYQLFENQIDSYGVDHSLFSTRDEIEYQLARAERENSLMQDSNSIDSSGSYTQYGTNFWGTSSDNNYGFGSENISENIENLNWGEKTSHLLTNYLQNQRQDYPGKTNTGIVAPFKDMLNNYNEMKNINLVGADNFFHCKANYEASKRGPWGEFVSKVGSFGREAFGLLHGDGIADVQKDWNANQMGWNGSKKGLTLEESCPTNPKAYYKFK